MATVCVGTSNLILLNAELKSESLLQTSRVEGSERCKLVWLQTRVDKCSKSCNVSRVEDNNHVLYVRAIFLDVVAELSSNLAVAFQQVLTCHAVLARSTT